MVACAHALVQLKDCAGKTSGRDTPYSKGVAICLGSDESEPAPRVYLLDFLSYASLTYVRDAYQSQHRPQHSRILSSI